MLEVTIVPPSTLSLSPKNTSTRKTKESTTISIPPSSEADTIQLRRRGFFTIQETPSLCPLNAPTKGLANTCRAKNHSTCRLLMSLIKSTRSTHPQHAIYPSGAISTCLHNKKIKKYSKLSTYLVQFDCIQRPNILMRPLLRVEARIQVPEHFLHNSNSFIKCVKKTTPKPNP